MAELNNAYAAALFALSSEAGTCEEVSSGLKDLVTVFSENPDYVELLSNPALPKSERAALAHAAFDGRISQDLVSFVLLLCDGGHLREIEDCAEDFEGLYQASLRTATAHVRSAVALTEEQKTRLCARLGALTGKTVTLSCTVDSALLGGLTVEIDGTVYDGSLRHRMDDMKKVMDQ